MCNLYLMYYNEDETHDYIDCGRQDDPTISRAVDARMEAEFAPKKPEPKSIGITTNTKPLLGHQLFLNFKVGKPYYRSFQSLLQKGCSESNPKQLLSYFNKNFFFI